MLLFRVMSCYECFVIVYSVQVRPEKAESVPSYFPMSKDVLYASLLLSSPHYQIYQQHNSVYNETIQALAYLECYSMLSGIIQLCINRYLGCFKWGIKKHYLYAKSILPACKSRKTGLIIVCSMIKNLL